MSRQLAPGSALPPRPFPTAPIAVVVFTGIAVGSIAYLAEKMPLVVVTAVVSMLAIAAIIVVSLRNRERAEAADLFLLRVHGILGWPEPSRQQIALSRWKGGWVGNPTRVDVIYNPLADEEVPEMIAEVRRLAKRAFAGPFKVTKHKKNRVRLILSATSAAERDRDEKIERVKLIIAKTFGTSATCKVEISAPAKDTSPEAQGTKLTEIIVHYEVAPKLSRSGVRASVESQISGVLEGRWRAFWDLPNDIFRMEPRPELPSVIPNPFVAPDQVDPLATYDDLAVPIGVDEDRNVISWRPKHDAHMMTTGKTGKGKTVCELGVIGFLAAHGWEIWGIDGKRFEMLGLRTWPNVKLIAGRIDHQARVAHKVYEEMQRRMAAYEAGEMRLEDFVPILFVIDEFKTFRGALLRWYRLVKPKGPGTQPPVLDEISDIASLGRKMRIHIVNGLQRPDADFLTGDMRDNFAFRVSWGRLSAEGAKMMWNNYTTGTTIPTNARGRGVAYNKQGQPVEIQGYWTPDPYQTDPDRPDRWVFPTDLQLVQNMHPRQRIHELMKIIDPDEIPDLEGDGKTDPLNYYDYMASRIIPAGDPELIDRAREISTTIDAEAAAEQDALNARLQRLHAAAEEDDPEISDDAERFEGYSPAAELFPEELLNDAGDLTRDGLLVLVDDDADTWGLIEYAELDPDDEDCITLSYRDFATGEPAAMTVPTSNHLITRSPVGGSEG